VVHFLYYVVLHVWIGLFGTSETATRSLSVLAFGLATAGLCLFVQGERGWAVALTATVCLATLPGVISVVTQARPYACALACATWSFVLLKAALDADGTPPLDRRQRWRRGSRWGAYGLCLVAMAAFNLTAVLIVPAHAAYCAHRRHGLPGRRLPAALLLSVVLAALASLPLALATSHQQAQVNWIANTPTDIMIQLGAGPFLSVGLSQAAGIDTGQIVGGGCAGVVFGAVSLCALSRLRRDWTATLTVTGLVWWAAPCLGLIGLWAVGVDLIVFRYVLVAVPGYCVVFGEGLVWLAGRRRAVAVAALVIVLGGAVPCRIAETGVRGHGDDFRNLAALSSGADQVVYADQWCRLIGAAYPAELGGADDVLLAQSPEDSDSLAGKNAPPETWRPGGRVVVYALDFDRLEDLADGVLDRLLEGQCVSDGDILHASRCSGVVFECPE
jgi:mannosyltransferase